MISVTGVGRVSAPPDVVRVRVTATALRPTVADAITSVDAVVAAMRAALAGHGVTGDDAASGAFTVGAEQVWTPEGRPQLAGYRCEHGLQVTLRDPAAVGRVLGDLVTAGGDDVRLEGVEPAVDDVAPLRVRARELAWADAVDRGSRIAALAGRELGAVAQVVEGEGPGVPVQPFAVAAGGAELLRSKAMDVGVQPGLVDVSVTLAVQWGLN
jgi:uncharacterized protein YggE